MAQELVFGMSFPLTTGEPGGVWIELLPSTPGPTLPYPVEVRVRKSSDGRLICTGLKLGWPGSEQETEITSKSLREIPLGQILPAIGQALAAASRLTQARPVPRDVTDRIPASGKITPELARELWAYAPQIPTAMVPAPPDHETLPRRAGRPRRSAEFQQRLADVYRKALEVDPRHPYRYVVDNATEDDGSLVWAPTDDDRYRMAFETTARKWIHRLRGGILGRTTQGKAGERPTADTEEPQ
jgi:hypothetical protein